MGILRDVNGQALNAATANLAEARNAPLLKDVRQAMLEGRWHSACTRCETEEKSGIRSRRIYETEIWQKQLNAERAVRSTRCDGEIEPDQFPLAHLDIRFGNLCNLKCRSCGPTDSSKWYSDYKKLWGAKFRESSVQVTLHDEQGRIVPSPDLYTWYESPNFWSQLDQVMPGIRQLYLVGGEPL